ncbi:Ig-like domain-containing protein [Clostridium sp. Marseille-QA1073]
MKKKLKSILILTVAFVFMSLSFNNAKIVKAASFDDAVIGIENLNNTPENSAKIGDKLNLPEKEWKRYDDSYKDITYEGNWYYNNENGSWNNGFHYSENNDSKLKFNFTGDKIRMTTCLHPNRSKNIIIKIDGKIMGNLSQYNISNQFQTLFYENISLKNTEHFVEIYTTDNIRMAIDAIDIDENGELLPYEIKAKSISLDKSSIDLKVGQTDKLTATVLPEDTANKKVIWSSSDESIAKVDENGNVTAIKEGQVTITAKVENTDLTATCEVNVSKLVEENKNNAILSISLVNGATKEYDVSMEEVNKFISWFEERANGKGSALYSFDKKLNPYKSVTEYIAHNKIVSFEVREYEISK